MIIDLFLDLFFPRYCLVCGRLGSWICSQCLNFVKVNDLRICPLCCRPSVNGLAHPGCFQSLGLDGLTSVFVYQGVVKKAINKFKNKLVTDLGETLLELFLTSIGEDKFFCRFLNQEKVLLVPVPLFKQRRFWRGFDQAELLGKKISQGLGVDFLPDLLIRLKNTRPQEGLTKAERISNLQSAFIINKKRLANSLTSSYFSILLFDDFWASGATMKQAARVLKKQGFAKVWGLTFACQQEKLN